MKLIAVPLIVIPDGAQEPDLDALRKVQSLLTKPAGDPSPAVPPAVSAPKKKPKRKRFESDPMDVPDKGPPRPLWCLVIHRSGRLPEVHYLPREIDALRLLCALRGDLRITIDPVRGGRWSAAGDWQAVPQFAARRYDGVWQ